MPAFCTECGSETRNGVRFCTRCGAVSRADGSRPEPSQPAKARRGGLKLILVVGGLFLAVCILSLGGIVYAGYRVKRKVSEISKVIKPADLDAALSLIRQGASGRPSAESTPGNPEPTLDLASALQAGLEITGQAEQKCPEFHGPEGSAEEETLAPGHVPLVPGLTLVSAWRIAEGDEEDVSRLDAVDGNAVEVTAIRMNGTSVAHSRSICRVDLARARALATGFGGDFSQVMNGATMFGASSLVFQDLKTQGSAAFAYLDFDSQGRPERWSGTLTRVEPEDVPLPVIVNDVRVSLPAIHAKGDLSGHASEIYLLDDPANPITLRIGIWGPSNHPGELRIRIVKISFPSAGASPQIEKQLEEGGRAEVYGIYFDFGSAAIRPESKPVLTEIAEALGRNPGWNLSIEGHTDNIGGAAANQSLSERRAAAVRAALVEDFQVSPERLTTSGYGASRPKESNETLEGRARNRRVELVRQ